MQFVFSKFEFASIRKLVSFLCILCVLCVSISAQQWKTLKPGIEYAEVRREVSGKDVNMNLLRLDLKKVRLDVHHAKDSAIGTETTSSIATRHKALAAINAGFFRLDTSQFAGDPDGLLVVDGNFLSEASNNRIQLIINNKPTITDVVMARTVLSQSVRLGNETFGVAGVNRERKKDDLVIYTPEFGKMTLTGNEGVEAVIVKGNIVSVSTEVGNTIIPKNGYVISAAGTFAANFTTAVKQNSTVTLIRIWADLPVELVKDREKLDAVAGVPQLIQGGRINITWQDERSSKAFVETRHPRTAVAKLKDGKFLMITVDGRTDASGGIGLQDLAEYLLTLGATDAMNLDGGGSTTMFVNGKIVNHPSDKEGERKVSDAILVTPRTTATRK